MISELIYTSSPTGLKPGAKGFCVVALTKGIPEMLVKQLEAMSGYRHLVTPVDGPKAGNPINWMHLKQGNGNSILVRVSDAGLDYSGRTNKLAQFMVVPADSRMASGPSNLLRGNNWLDRWEGEARTLPHRGQMDSSDSPTGPCSYWKQTAGDAGWAGVIAEAVATRNSKDWNLIYRPGIDCLRLVDEAIGLLPESLRWNVTFATYFTGSCTNQLPCQWRFIVAGSKEHDAARNAHSNVIDLTSPKPCEHVSKWVDAARSGVMVEMPKPTAAPTRPTTLPSSLQLSRGVQDSGGFQSYDMQATDGYRVSATSAASSGDSQLNEGYGPPSQPTPYRNSAKKKSTPVALIASIAAVIALLIGGVIGAGGMAAIQSQEVAEVNHKLNLSEAEKDRLEKEKGDLDKKISKLGAQESELTKIKDELKTKSAELTTTKGERDTAKTDSETAEASLNKEIATLKNEIAELQKRPEATKPPADDTTPRVRFDTFSSDKKYKLNERTIKNGTIVVFNEGKLEQGKDTKSNKAKELIWNEKALVEFAKDELSEGVIEYAKQSGKELRPEKGLLDGQLLWLEFADENELPVLLWHKEFQRIGLKETQTFPWIPGLPKQALGEAKIVRAIFGEDGEEPPKDEKKLEVKKTIEARYENEKVTQTIDIKLNANGMTVITNNQRIPKPQLQPNANAEVKAKAEADVAAFAKLLSVSEIDEIYRKKPIVVEIEFPENEGLKDLKGDAFAMLLNFEFFLDLPQPETAARTGSGKSGQGR